MQQRSYPVARFDKLKDTLQRIWDRIRESDAVTQLKAKYDDLDTDRKLYVNLVAVAAMSLIVVVTTMTAIARINSLKAEANEKEELIGFLQQSADQIRSLKAQQSQLGRGIDINSPISTFIDSIITNLDFDRKKVEVSNERNGQDEKDIREFLVDVKFTQTNLRQLVRFLFQITEQSEVRHLNIKNLDIDTKNDASGYMDATVTLSAFRSRNS